MPVRFDGARTSGAASGGTAAVVLGSGPEQAPSGPGSAERDLRGGSRRDGRTGAASSAGQPKRDASEVARSPPAACQPTMASTRLVASAEP